MNRMIKMKLIFRRAALDIYHKQQLHTTVRLFDNKSESSSSSSSDSDQTETKKQYVKKAKSIERSEESKKETLNLLNSLLAKMSEDKGQPKTVDRAIPKRKPLPKPVRESTLEEKLTVAAKDAAAKIGGDVKKTETELLEKIFTAGTPTTKPIDEKPAKTSEPSLSELLGGMKIDKSPQKKSSDYGLPLSRSARVQELAKKFQQANRAERRRFDVDRQTTSTTDYKIKSKEVPGNLHAGPRLMILDSEMKTSEDTPTLDTWELLVAKECKLLVTHAPENIFEEMIQWTDRGLLWKFPIDNEYGLDDEQNVHFSEHVFMERHLQNWCPKKGPIRHFMELVCVGLSKNPYMTVQEKKDHIMWYKNYFGEKQDLLKEIGAIDKNILPTDTKKQIEA